jgi:hypothetical protein
MEDYSDFFFADEGNGDFLQKKCQQTCSASLS